MLGGLFGTQMVTHPQTSGAGLHVPLAVLGRLSTDGIRPATHVSHSEGCRISARAGMGALDYTTARRHGDVRMVIGCWPN